MSIDVLHNFDTLNFQEDLLNWYSEYKRDLPWRNSQNPYKVWVSEIMLQQTKVDTVIPYFNHFMEKYPTIFDLAKADEEDVLKSWEGLGYYSRARNLQTAVREVVEEYSGKVPDNKKELGKLKGVGPYTQGAILSIAYNQAEPAVDGNVMRVFSRLLLINDDIAATRIKKQFEKIVGEVISTDDPASFNQAIMDLGATICTPKKPACLLCPVQEYCRAFNKGVQEELPVKKKAKKQKNIPYVAIIVKKNKNQYLIEKRPNKGLLADLYQFPMVEMSETDIEAVRAGFFEEYGMKLINVREQGKLKHVFSHIIWNMTIYTAEIFDEESKTLKKGEFIKEENIKVLPFPVPHQKMMPYMREM